MLRVVTYLHNVGHPMGVGTGHDEIHKWGFPITGTDRDGYIPGREGGSKRKENEKRMKREKRRNQEGIRRKAERYTLCVSAEMEIKEASFTTE